MPAPILATHSLSYRLPEGRTVLDQVSFGLTPGRHALIGDNGAGKSTLLKLITGELTPSSGTVQLDGDLAHLQQNPAVDEHVPVAELLGVQQTLDALAAIEAGSVREEHFDAVGDDWDIREQILASLARAGLEGIELSRTARSLSGGELILLSLTGLVLRRPSLLILDEPTNNLDAHARRRLSDILDQFSGTVLVVSHDRDLLEEVDSIGELRRGSLRWFGGGLSLYEEIIAAESEAAAQQVAQAKADVRRQRRELTEQRRRQAARDRQGKQSAQSMPKILANARKSKAEANAGRASAAHHTRLEEARKSLEQAEEQVRKDQQIHLDLPGAEVPKGREVLEVVGLRPPHGTAVVDLHLRGPQRVALTGPNGVGKTSVLRCITGEAQPLEGSAGVAVPFRCLPQNLQLLDDGASVLENMQRFAPTTTPVQARHRLAQFLIRGDAVHQPAGSLSGGERWRATLACLLLAEPTPQLLILDEPTNNLDLASVAHLTHALQAYSGALLVVSHDERFLRELQLDQRVDLREPEEMEAPPRGEV